jgi:LPXTG-motif cell wall-anchored protein
MTRARWWMPVVATAVVVGALVSGGASAQNGSRALTVAGSPVAAGGTVTVAGAGCAEDAVVIVGVLDAGNTSELASASTTGGGNAGWSVRVRINEATRPGTYPVVARCSSYDGAYGAPIEGGSVGAADGYDGYGGYDGGSGFEYDRSSLIVLPPAAPPASDGPLSVEPSVVARGQQATVTGGGFGPGEQVTVILYSSPVVLASATTGADGSLSTVVTVPADTALGAHEVVAMNATSAVRPARTLRTSIEVTDGGPVVTVTPVTTVGNQVLASTSGGSSGSGSLPLTGLDPWPLILAGLAMVATGAVLLARFRRRPAG